MEKAVKTCKAAELVKKLAPRNFQLQQYIMYINHPKPSRLDRQQEVASPRLEELDIHRAIPDLLK